MPQKHFYEFGPFRIDVALNRLERAGEAIPLAPKAFDLLALLAKNTDRLMPKTELMETLWPNTFVEEANLTQHVYTLRKALGDQPDGRPYVETLPRRGYRLTAEVREVTADSTIAHDAHARVSSHAEPSQVAVSAELPIVLEGERKRATVLQCCISNAAAIVERLGSAATYELTGRLAALAAEEIARYEGVVTERRAAGFVAVFGVPAVHEDDGRRATLAAIEIGRRFRALVASDAADEEPFDVQIGVGTGPIVVSRVESDRQIAYSAVGEAARVADLLEQLAEPGTILIGEATRRAIDGFVDVLPAGVQAAGTAAYRVVGPVAGAARATRFARTLTRFVGRRREVALLEGLAAQARSGNGQVVGIVGEPGMGKSRLVYEFTRAMAADGSLTLLEGRCVSYGSLVPYLPLADLIRAQCGVSDNETPETIRRAIDRAVRDNHLPADAGAWLLRLIGLVDSERTLDALSPEAIKARMFDALRGLFLKASTRTPLAVIVEDIHWIDRTSEEFLATLVERLVGARVLVVATYRPGYRPPWLDRSYLTQITLNPLTADAGAELVESVASAGALPETVSAAIVEKAEGNPFFIEELARTVVEHGADAQSIPDTVQGVIMARVDRLPADAKLLLQTASVIGREVPLRLLTNVWRGPDVAAQLAELCRLEFMYERAGSDEQIVIFKHALTQDVAYDGLLARTRRELHLRTAQALATVYGDQRDDLAATFAYHYVRTDLIEEAVHWLTRAADRAARVYANAEAILHLDLAARRLQRLPEGPDRDRRMLDVALRHAHSLYFLGRFRESVDVLLPHEGRLARLNDATLSARYLFWLAHMYSRLGDQARATDSAHRAIDAGTRANDTPTVGKAHGLLALEGHWSGNTVDGIPHGEEAVRMLRAYPDQRWWLGMAHFYLAMNHLLTGEFETALDEAKRADGVGREIGDPRLETYAGFITGWIEVTRGHADVAVMICRRSLEKAPDRVSRAYASMILGLSLLEAGDHGHALEQLRPTVAELEGFGFLQWHGLATVLIGEALRRYGRLDDALTATRTGIDIAARAQYWYGVGTGERVAARIACDDGRRQDAADGFSRALRTFERIGARFEASRTRAEAARTASAV